MMDAVLIAGIFLGGLFLSLEGGCYLDKHDAPEWFSVYVWPATVGLIAGLAIVFIMLGGTR